MFDCEAALTALHLPRKSRCSSSIQNEQFTLALIYPVFPTDPHPFPSLCSRHFRTLLRSGRHHLSIFTRSQFSILWFLATQFSGNYSHHYISPNHDWIGNWPLMWLQFTHESEICMKTCSHTSAYLMTLTRTSLGTNQNYVAVTNRPSSIPLLTTLRTDGLRFNEHFAHSGKVLSGRYYITFKLHIVLSQLPCCLQFPTWPLHPTTPFQSPYHLSPAMFLLRVALLYISPYRFRTLTGLHYKSIKALPNPRNRGLKSSTFCNEYTLRFQFQERVPVLIYPSFLFHPNCFPLHFISFRHLWNFSNIHPLFCAYT